YLARPHFSGYTNEKYGLRACVPWNWLLRGELAMNGELDNGDKDNDVEDDFELEDTVVLTDVIDVDNVGDISVEINVEELIAKIEAGEGDAEQHRKEIRRRLDELEEQRRIEKELESTFNFNLDDDL
ncbi:MAG: hypothetical protein OEM76_06015, partial [Gammaproteobacteria bacterium]|nr:hypothetical protein [Gammaproteobacteria bacterium]